MRPRTAVVALAFAAGLAGPVVGTASPACAAENPHAALVVAHDGVVLRLCVALDAERVSGLHLIELAGAQHGLDHAFGYGGQAVCRLDGVGTASETCLEDDAPDYWAYFRGDGSGGWRYSSVGAGSTLVEDGDVEGWAWGAGTGSSHLAPPTAAFADVCEQDEPEPSPDPKDGEGRDRERDPEGSGGTAPPASPSPEPADGREHEGERDRDRDRDGDRDREKEGREPSAEAARAVASMTTAPDAGPSAGALGAIGVTLGLMATGVILARRRRAA